MTSLTEKTLNTQLRNQVATLDTGVMIKINYNNSDLMVILHSVKGWEARPLEYKKRNKALFTHLTIKTNEETHEFRTEWFYIQEIDGYEFL